jgi:hypothetical protein
MILCETCGSATDVRTYESPYSADVRHECDECGERAWERHCDSSAPSQAERLELDHRAKRTAR